MCGYCGSIAGPEESV
jgi:hypothetical protein